MFVRNEVSAGSPIGWNHGKDFARGIRDLATAALLSPASPVESGRNRGVDIRKQEAAGVPFVSGTVTQIKEKSNVIAIGHVCLLAPDADQVTCLLSAVFDLPQCSNPFLM